MEPMTPPAKYLKMAGYGEPSAALIHADKIHTFVKLYNEILHSVGKPARARILVSMHHTAVTDMVNLKRLTVIHAQRILTAYRNLTKVEKS